MDRLGPTTTKAGDCRPNYRLGCMALLITKQRLLGTESSISPLDRPWRRGAGSKTSDALQLWLPLDSLS